MYVLNINKNKDAMLILVLEYIHFSGEKNSIRIAIVIKTFNN